MTLHFIDTEFIEDGKTIDLISIGIVCEDGREYYAVNRECRFELASPWVWENVLEPIGIYEPLERINPSNPWVTAKTKDTLGNARNRKQIRNEILEFCGLHPEFWADYASYDWVAFCQLFGTMMDLPQGFPMYCNDIQQWRRGLGNPELPQHSGTEHNALEDARDCKRRWEFLKQLSESRVVEKV